MKNYHLHLRGFVGGYDFDSRHVQNVLDANKGKRVDVLIDSLGGSVATALTIASAFRNHGDVHVHFVGMNASAATIASMGAKKITMDASAMYLVHKCSAEFFQWASLNADQLEEQIKDLSQMKSDLEKIDANVSTLYAKRCGKKAEELLELMKVGGYISLNTRQQQWGSGAIEAISERLQKELPGLQGFSASSIRNMRQFYETWHEIIIQQPLAGEIQSADKQQDTIQQPTAGEIQSPVATQLQLAPSRLDFSHDVFEILNQTGRGEIERVTFR